MSKIVMKNADEVEGICPITGRQFKTVGVGYYYEDKPISREGAENRGFVVDKKFELPEIIKTRDNLGLYLRSVGLKPGSPEYNRVYKDYSQAMPVPKV